MMSPYSLPKREEYKYWLFQNKYDNPLTFLGHVSELVEQNNVRINFLIISSLTSLLETFNEYKPQNYIMETRNDEPVFTFRLTKKLEEGERSATAVAVKYSDNTYLIVSDCKTGDFKEIITKFVNKYIPDVSRLFLTSAEIRKIVESLENDTTFRIMIKSSVCKRRLPESNGREAQVTYTELSYNEVFDNVIEHDQWVSSINYRADEMKKTTRVLKSGNQNLADIYHEIVSFLSEETFSQSLGLLNYEKMKNVLSIESCQPVTGVDSRQISRKLDSATCTSSTLKRR